MTSYTITRYTVEPRYVRNSPLRRYNQRCSYWVQRPAAVRAFRKAVYEMIRDDAALDTRRGRVLHFAARDFDLSGMSKRTAVFTLALKDERVEFFADHLA